MLCCHVCRVHARPCLSTGWALNRLFDLTFGTAAMVRKGWRGYWLCLHTYAHLLACSAPALTHSIAPSCLSSLPVCLLRLSLLLCFARSIPSLPPSLPLSLSSRDPVTRWSFGRLRGDNQSTHAHPNEQVKVVVSKKEKKIQEATKLRKGKSQPPKNAISHSI